MKARLQQLLNKEQLTPVRFAETVGVQRSSVSHILSGRNNPSLEFIQKILLKFPQISSDWLINGIGDMYRDNATIREIKPPGLFAQLDEDEKEPYSVKSAIKSADEPVKSSAESGVQHTSDIINTGSKANMAEVSNSPVIERIVVFYKDRTFREYKPE